MTLFSLGKMRIAEPVQRAGELARGDYWSLVRKGDDYFLCYLSDELLGREKRLLLCEHEVRPILSGHIPVEQLLLPHG